MWIVQGFYGKQYGWEDLTAEDKKVDALMRLHEYNENELGVPHRLKFRKEKEKP